MDRVSYCDIDLAIRVSQYGSELNHADSPLERWRNVAEASNADFWRTVLPPSQAEQSGRPTPISDNLRLRTVTPEVAGSSTVAPISICRCLWDCCRFPRRNRHGKRRT